MESNNTTSSIKFYRTVIVVLLLLVMFLVSGNLNRSKELDRLKKENHESVTNAEESYYNLGYSDGYYEGYNAALNGDK